MRKSIVLIISGIVSLASMARAQSFTSDNSTVTVSSVSNGLPAVAMGKSNCQLKLVTGASLTNSQFGIKIGFVPGAKNNNATADNGSFWDCGTLTGAIYVGYADRTNSLVVLGGSHVRTHFVECGNSGTGANNGNDNYIWVTAPNSWLEVVGQTLSITGSNNYLTCWNSARVTTTSGILINGTNTLLQIDSGGLISNKTSISMFGLNNDIFISGGGLLYNVGGISIVGNNNFMTVTNGTVVASDIQLGAGNEIDLLNGGFLVLNGSTASSIGGTVKIWPNAGIVTPTLPPSIYTNTTSGIIQLQCP